MDLKYTFGTVVLDDFVVLISIFDLKLQTHLIEFMLALGSSRKCLKELALLI